MPKIAIDPPSAILYHLFPTPGIQEYQQLGPDPSRLARATRGGVSRREAPAIRGAAAWHPQSHAARARSCRPAAERVGAGEGLNASRTGLIDRDIIVGINEGIILAQSFLRDKRSQQASR